MCRATCPTSAIGEDRVLLHGERCLMFINENPGEWPDWISPSVHNCLIGCLLCQRACPANPELKVEDTGVRFSPEETQVLLDDKDDRHEGRAWKGIRAKLEQLGQPYQEPVLGRNLRALLQARR